MIEPIHQWITLVFLVLMTGLVVAYDVAINRFVGEHATISRVMLRCSLDHPLVTPVIIFAVGITIGHILFPQYVR